MITPCYFESEILINTIFQVADCICLMSLNHLEAVPVDTHVYQIAANLYLKHLKGRKSITDAVYNEIGDHFRKLYGPLAGWAHTVKDFLFSQIILFEISLACISKILGSFLC